MSLSGIEIDELLDSEILDQLDWKPPCEVEGRHGDDPPPAVLVLFMRDGYPCSCRGTGISALFCLECWSRWTSHPICQCIRCGAVCPTAFVVLRVVWL